jgi:Crp-like helix-turn-helix protein
MQNAIHSASERRLACPDCPAYRVCAPVELLPGPVNACAFESLRIDARSPLPDRWHDSATLALVRRGIVVRQRVDARGRLVTVDAAGIGSVVPIDAGGARLWAVSDAVLCLLPPAGEEIWSRRNGAGVAGMMRTVLDRVERLAEVRGRSTSIARTALLFCVLGDMLTPLPRSFVPVELPQRTLAALAGLRQESICRAIKRLLDRGWIARDERGFQILDRAALEST